MKIQGLKLLSRFTISIFLFAFFLILPSVILAHPGNTASDGCHYCWTNCASWGEVYGERHCHGGSTYSYPSTPTCPLFSSYNSITAKCECYSGYIASGSQCISQTQACQNQLGFSSRYNSLTGNCECSYSYVIDSTGKCTSGNSFCWNKYGYNSTYDSLSNNCKCSYGYKFNSTGTRCISNDQSCQDQFGYNSKATLTGDKCECKYGYVWQGNTCVWDTPSYTIVSTIAPTTKPTLRPTAVPEKTSPPTPSPDVKGISSTPSSSPTNTPVPTPKPPTTGNNTLGYFVLAGLVIFLIRVFTKKDNIDTPIS